MSRAWLALGGAFLFAILISCSTHPPTKPEPLPHSPSELIWDTKNGKDFIGKRLTLNLSPKSYTISPFGILVFHGPTANSPPTIVFICAPPPNNTRALRVTGTVRSCESDGIDRGGVMFTITVDVAEIIVR